MPRNAGALREADSDPAVRTIVATGAGRGFGAGAGPAVLNVGAEAVRKFVPAAENPPVRLGGRASRSSRP